MDRTWIYEAQRIDDYFLGTLNNSFKLLKTMQKIRRHRVYLAHAKSARI
jgi:hypothetical protein